ncbi:hypothetical protein FB451DRAFT_1394481 [Mycena latifolia]|nr:hypothetical protein FB451DRAFT_1394481 [Mycena latifolia]
MASILVLELPPDARTLHNFVELGVALEWLLNYESALFEKHLLDKTTPRGITNLHSYDYERVRRLEVRVASEARKEALSKRTVKYREMWASAGNDESDVFPDDIPTRVSVIMDIDIETLKQLHSVNMGWLRGIHAAFTGIWNLEKKRIETRCSTWENTPTSSNKELAQAVFAAYPSAKCANDPELFDIMAGRRCMVFDFAWDKTRSESSPSFPNFNVAGPGVSLLRCPQEWLPRLTELTQSNPNIFQSKSPTLLAVSYQSKLENISIPGL